jgi:hypothetical protein
MSKAILGIIICLIVLIALGTQPGSAADNATNNNELTDFRGKIVMLIARGSGALNDEGMTEYLSDALIQKVGGRTFIVGTTANIASTTDDTDEADVADDQWRKGSQIGVAWDHVYAYYVYTPEQFEKVARFLAENN